MSKSARFGPVQVEFRDDGSLWIYQANPDVVLGARRAEELITWLFTQGPVSAADAGLIEPGLESDFYANQSTVPDGVINTSAGPAWDESELELLSDTEREHDHNAEQARAELVEEALKRGIADVEAGSVKPVPPTVLYDEGSSLKDLRQAAETLGLPTYGSKKQLLERLNKAHGDE